MKKVLLLFIPVILFIAGCSQSDLSPTSPVPVVQKSLIQLPPGNTPRVEDIFSASEIIEGSKGGMVKMNESYDSPNGTVTIKAKLKIPKNAFSGTEDIEYQIHSEDGSIDFYPGMSFDKDLIYDLKFTGLDLSGIDPDQVRFMYVDEVGNTYPVEYSDLIVNVDRGVLEVKNAVITHFSRYIWSR